MNAIAALLRSHAEAISAFDTDPAGCLEIY